MEDFNLFFEHQLNERRTKTFKTKKQLNKLLQGEIQQDTEEENAGTAIQNSKDNVEDITKRNMLESRDIQLEKVKNRFSCNFAAFFLIIIIARFATFMIFVWQAW